MTRLSTSERGVSTLYLLTIIAVLALGGFAVTHRAVSTAASQQPRPRPRVDNLATLVRGYLAVAVGRTAKVDQTGGVFSRELDGKDIFLPGLEVYLEDPQTNAVSKSGTTDLSGRFSLYAPGKGRYRLCWKSKTYGDGCTAVYISGGSGAAFLSTVNIRLPARKEYVAVFGNVKNADGSSVRTFDPLLNINAFATVNTDSEKGDHADVYVNNFGDYLVPYVPTRQNIKLTATIEGARFTQDIFPAAQIERSSVHRINIKIQNNRPTLDPLVGLDSSNKLVQNPIRGSQIRLRANARDKDGDEVKYAWFVDPSEGEISDRSGSDVKWKLPSKAGTFSVTVVAYDGKGGYDKAVLSRLVGARGVPFSGVVVEPSGSPVKDAEIEIVGSPIVQTDASGRFATNVIASDRYIFNVRKQGYALNSQIYDRGLTGGRWILRRGQVVTIDPTRDVVIGHKRTERDCPGPDSVRAGLGVAGNSLNTAQWQDGKGNIVDPPSKRTDWRTTVGTGKQRGSGISLVQDKREPVIMPRDLKLGKCGPGVSVQIPANSILDSSGNPAVAPFQATIATVDLLSAQQMPGDDTVVERGGGGRYLKSFGAGSLDLPAGFKLRSGATAKVTIPVDRARLAGGSIPPTVPFLSYDEQRGLWIEEDTMTLTTVGGVQVYVGNAKHFTTYNADTFFSNAACLRVFSPGISGNYDLEVMSPYPDGTPHYKKYPIDNVSEQEHVIYNITPNANMTLAPMTQGANPRLLGFYVVNSGPPQNPSNSPNIPPGAPYLSCQNFVVMTNLSAPDSPASGEFLHGLGFIDAANLGFPDAELTAAVPTGNALRDAIIAASENYYTTLDPTNAVNSFEKFKTLHGFSQNPATPAASEIVASYANSGDLGFGRDMHCIKKGNNDVVCYVSNYGKGYTNIFPGGGTDDHDDANAAGQRATVGSSSEIASVAMEYSDLPGAPGNKVVKFYVYKAALTNPAAVTATNPTGAYARSISANLDGRGERPVPQLCMICHGGQVPQQTGGVPAFGNNAQVTLGSRFIPFDYRFYTFPTNPANLTKADQEPNFKQLNEQIVNFAPVASAGDPIRDVVDSLYGGGATQLPNAPVPGWNNGASAAAPGQANFYTKVIAPDCRICHASQPFTQLQFNNSDKFLNMTQFNPGITGGAANRLMLGTAQSRVCSDYVMPHAFRTHEIFWDVYWDVASWGAPPSPPMRTEFQNFGNSVPAVGTSTWKAGLCTTFVGGGASSPSLFFEQVIQPIFNGKCVGCHIAGGAAPFSLTQGDSFPALVPGRVVPGDDNPATVGNKLLFRTTHVTPAVRMPPNCFRAPEPPVAGRLPCLSTIDIDTIKAWIRSGAN